MNNPVYLYSFEHRTIRTKEMFGWPEWAGVMHGYEIDYVFSIPCFNDNYTNQECTLSQQIMKYWSNFAKTGYRLSCYPFSVAYFLGYVFKVLF